MYTLCLDEQERAFVPEDQEDMRVGGGEDRKKGKGKH